MVRVIGDDQHAVVVAEILRRHLQVIFAPFANEREVRVVIADPPSFCSGSMIVREETPASRQCLSHTPHPRARHAPRSVLSCAGSAHSQPRRARVMAWRY
jgi:hypothetical protein